MSDLLMMYGIAILLIVCGFAALLLQKTYVNEDGAGTQTEIDLPFFGKLKTNYPALIFVLLGCAAAYYTFENRAREWVITGTLELPDDPELADLQGSGFSWNKGTFTTFPSKYAPRIDRDGSFELRIEVAGAGALENFIKELMYDHPEASTHVPLDAEAVRLAVDRAIDLHPVTVDYYGE